MGPGEEETILSAVFTVLQVRRPSHPSELWEHLLSPSPASSPVRLSPGVKISTEAGPSRVGGGGVCGVGGFSLPQLCCTFEAPGEL